MELFQMFPVDYAVVDMLPSMGHVEPDTGTANSVMRITAGGEDYIDISENKFLAEQQSTPGVFGYLAVRGRVFPGDVPGTTEDSLDQSVRFSKTTFGYEVSHSGPELACPASSWKAAL